MGRRDFRGLSIDRRLQTFLSKARVATLALACWLTGAADSRADEPRVQARLTYWDRADFRGELRLRVGGADWTKLKFEGRDKVLDVGVLTLPSNTKDLALEGKLSWTHPSAGPQTSHGSVRRPVVDIADLTRPLRNSRLAWSERWKQFEKAQAAFEAKHAKLLGDTAPRLERGDRDGDSELATAARRLGFALPAEHTQLLRDFGAWSANDTQLHSAKDLQTAYQQMIDLWETPTKSLNSLPEKTRAFLKQSVILGTEAGDGYSGLVCQPTRESGAVGAYRFYWLTQDEIANPRLLQDRDGNPYDYDQALCWLAAQQLIKPYADTASDVTFVDTNSPIPLEYRVEPQFPRPRALEAQMTLDWERFR